MTLGGGEIAVIAAVGGTALLAVVLALTIAMWMLRRTITMVKRLVIAGVVLALFGLVATTGIGGYVAYRLQSAETQHQRH